jgi:hypothetical protein
MKKVGGVLEKEKLKELIAGHKQRFLARRGLVGRDLQKELSRFLPQREIVLISGVRRCGKSSLMRLVCDDLMTAGGVPAANILFLNFEDERFISFTPNDFESLFEAYLELENPVGRKYLFLDEIQNVPGWEKWLNRLYEFEDIKVFVSGSNAGLLGSEVSTALTGRNRQVILWPFSFREFLALRECLPARKDLYLRDVRLELRRLFAEYLALGGFPEVLKNSDPTLLEQYFKDILYRDLIARYSIRNIREIKELTLFLASHVGTTQSYQNLQSLTGIRSIGTVRNYLGALAEVFLFHFVDLFAFSIRRQIYNPSKVYCVDPALSTAVSFRFSLNAGRILENLVFLELKRRNREVFYWKSGRGGEVDFIVREGLKVVEGIQVCRSLAEEKTRRREVQALLEAGSELQADRLTILTEDEEEAIAVGDTVIRVVPLWKWLLDPQPLQRDEK